MHTSTFSNLALLAKLLLIVAITSSSTVYGMHSSLQIGEPTYIDSEGNIQFGEKPKPWVDIQGTVHFDQKIDQDINLNPINNPYENSRSNYGNNSAANDVNYQRELNKIFDDLQEDFNRPTLNKMLQPIAVNPSTLNNSTVSKSFVGASARKKAAPWIILFSVGIAVVILSWKYIPKLKSTLEVKTISESRLTKSQAMAILKEKKDLLDLGVITADEYEKAKITLTPYLVS